MQLDVFLHSADGTDADELLYAVVVDELPGVDADGGNTHAGAHDRNGVAFIGAGKPQHIAHAVELDGV